MYHRLNQQDTCVALQALSKYSEKTAGAKLDLRVSVSSEKDANWKRKYHVDAKNALYLRQEEVCINKRVYVYFKHKTIQQVDFQYRPQQ